MPDIEIQDVGVISFPESMSHEDIEKAASELYDKASSARQGKADAEQVAQAESLGAVPGGAPEIPSAELELTDPGERSSWNKFRESDWGRRLFGPTPLEKEAGISSQGSPVEIASKMLEFTSVPPPVKPVVQATVEALNPLQVLGARGEAVGEAVGNVAANLPLAPLGGGATGKAALGIFSGDYAIHLPEARNAYRKALESGDAPEAIRIATETMLGGALLGAGALHATASRPEIIAPKTTDAVKQSETTLKGGGENAIYSPTSEVLPTVQTRTGEGTAQVPTAERPVENAQAPGGAQGQAAPGSGTEITPSQRVQAASVKIRENAADAMSAGRSALESVRAQIEAARAKPGQAAAGAAEAAAGTLEAGRQAPAQASADVVKRAQAALDRADDIFGLAEDAETGAAVKPADISKVLDDLFEAIKPLPLKGGESVEKPKEEVQAKGNVLTPAIVSGEKVFTGSSHKDILAKAKKAFEAKEISMDEYMDIVQGFADDSKHVFQTGDGKILNRAEAGKVFDEMQGNPPGTTPALQSEMLPKPEPISKGEAVFSGYQFDMADNPTYKIPGSRPGIMRDVSADTAKSAGYSVPEKIPSFEEWKSGQTTPTPETPPGQRIGIVPEGTQFAMETVGNPQWWKRYFTAQKGLPEGVPEAWQKRMGEVRSETRSSVHAARDLANALKKEYNISFGKSVTRGLSDVPKPVMESIQKALTGEVGLDTLAEPLREPVQKIRDHVDQVSMTMMEVLGEDNPMRATIGENLGIYLNRSYRIFDDPKWLKKIPVDVRNRAETYIGQKLQDSGVPIEDVPDMARTRLNEMLADWSDQGLDKLMRQGKLGSKDISIFMQRKDIAPEIRAVMGEYSDPVTNYIRSITKMARWLGDQEFLNKVKDIGMGKWLFEEGENRPTGFDHRIAAESSDTMYPLNGLRTSKEIKTLFETLDKNRPTDNFFAKVYFGVNAWTKQAKVVYSALTQARNFIGNPFFNLKSGHFNFRDYGKAFQAQWADIAGSNKKAQAFYQEMAKYGLVDENVVVNDLRNAMKDAGLQDPSFEDYSMRGVARAIKLAADAPQRAYRLPDEMGKTVGWLAEQNDLRAAHPDWSIERVKQEAATRVRNEYPTYSMIPEWLQQFRKQPLVGPFVNFAYETMRTSYHTLRNGSTDLFSEGSKRQKVNGAKKLAGFGITVGASGAILNNVGQMVFGTNNDTDSDTRRFLPFYSKNAQLIPLGKDGTKVRYLNYSYLNPYSQFNDAFIAAVQNSEKGIMQASIKGFAELLRPFSNEQMLYGALEQSVKNRDAFGNEIYNPLDEPDTKMSKVAQHLTKSILPGTVERFQKRILPALTGEKTKSGQELNPAMEIASELTGLRMDETDLLKQFSFKMKEFQENEDVNARRLATKVLFNPNAPTMDSALAAYKLGDDARFQIWRELFKDVNALMRQGATEDQIEDSLKAGKMSRKDINNLLSGEYVPLSITSKDYRAVNIDPDDRILDAIQEEADRRVGKKLE